MVLKSRFLFIAVVVSSLLFGVHSQAQLIIAHRGASADAPENTLAAFNLAWERGADGIEADFYLTKDGDIICTHDIKTSRVTGRKVDVWVDKTDLADLKKLDVGWWKDSKYTGERMPTLREVLGTIPEGKKIFIEIKCGPEIVPVLKKQLAEFSHFEPGQLVIICFKKKVIKACRDQIPELPANWLNSFKKDKITGKWSPNEDDLLASLKECSASGLSAKAQPSLFSPEFVKRIRDAGLGFHSWTIDSVVLAKRFQALGVDTITTNRPSVIRKGLLE